MPLKVIVIAQSVFLAGLTIAIFKHYLYDKRLPHIAFMAFSHVLLTFIVSEGIVSGRIPWPSIQAYIVLLSFLMSDYAIFELYLFSPRVRKKMYEKKSRNEVK